MERRTFLKNTAAISAISILSPAVAFGSRANAAIQIGIIGCGSRGTAVISSMSQNANINIIAMADIFADKLQEAKPKLDKLNANKGFPAVAAANMYQGSKAYLDLINNKDVQAVLISAPCYTHPPFLEAAIAAGKHVYCEKPVALDVEGCKRVQLAGEKLNGKQSVVIGFQIRYATPYVEMIRRIQQGDIGDVINAQLYYFSSENPLKPTANMPFDEARIRNHFHFRELSGGIFLDQAIHMLDVCNWALQKHPVSAIGMGGKKGAPSFGNAWSNYQVLYQYPDEVHVSCHSTQFGKTFGDVCARFIGSKGIAEAHYSGGVFIQGEKPWDSGIFKGDASAITQEQRTSGAFLSSLSDADPNKGKAFIKSIETGNYLNETKSGAESTLTAILGREAAMTRKENVWETMLASNERIDAHLNLTQFDKK